MKALSDLWNRPLIRCPFAILICQYAYRDGHILSAKPQCALTLTYSTCNKIQTEVEGKPLKNITVFV